MTSKDQIDLSKIECDINEIFISSLEDTHAKKSICERRDPFEFMKITDNTFLSDIKGRSACPKCNKSRKFFCYTCYVPTATVGQLLPVVKVSVTFQK